MPAFPAPEEMFMIKPPFFSISGMICFMKRNVPLRLTSITSSNSLTCVSHRYFLKPTPALFTSTSIFPNFSSVISITFFTSSSILTSPLMNTAFPPASLISHLIDFDGAYTPESFREKSGGASRPAKAGEQTRESYLLLYGVPKQNSYGYLAYALKAEGILTVLVPEMRPELWGAHMVCRELLQKNIPATLISDNMMGTLFAQGRIKRLVLFCTELTQQGPVGICGSLLAAHLAQAHGVPVEYLESEGREPPQDLDVSTFLGQRVVPEAVAIYPIEKEVIPWSLLKENKAGAP